MNLAKGFLLAVLLAGSFYAHAATGIVNLKVQDTVEPLMIEDTHPLFSWQMQSDERGAMQQAYQIVVMRQSDNKVMWNSGKVNSGNSDNIKYLGVALQAETAYSWELTVWDAKGKELKSSSKFETGLMNPSIRAWGGAQFIGSKSKVLDAASHSYFEICSEVQIKKGDKASLILGANDFRLKDAFQNVKNMSGTNYVRVELDLSGVGQAQGASLNVYRVGYDKGDKADVPMLTINQTKYPKTNINQIFTSANKSEKHTIRVFVQTSMMYFVIDGKDVLTGETTQGRRFGGGFAVGNVGGETFAASRFQIGTYGRTHDFNTEPNLCSVGFAAALGTEATFSNYVIKECGQAKDKVVFGITDYDLFQGMEGVSVNGSDINVKNDTKKLIVGYADPSRGAQTMLRTTFNLKKKIKSAKLYATSMGVYELFINGKRVGEDWFAPGDSQYRELLGYNAYDVTGLMADGDNCLAAQLFPGWYTGYMTFTITNYNFFGDYEGLLSKLVVTYEDGKKEVITSNPNTWQVFNDGPVRYGNFFNGERYDARKEASIAGWNTASFKADGWKQAQVIPVRDWINFEIKARYDEPVRVRETLTATRVAPTHSADNHTYVYDMGVNMVGVPSISIPAGYLAEGDTVILRYAEQLYPGFKGDDKYYVNTYGPKGKNVAGRPLYETVRAAYVTDFYVAKGSDAVTIQPTSTYRGYQYVQVTLPHHQGPLPVENVKGLVLSSDRLSTSTYTATTSDGNKTAKLVNQLFKNIQRSQLGNFFTIPTDCPQRNERMGWTGDAQAYSRTATYNGDERRFLRQWMASLRADQGVGNDQAVPGGIGSTVPTYNMADDPTFADGTTWSAAICMVPWQLYNQYGNTQVIEENIEAMMNWLNGMDFYDFSEQYPHLSSKASGLADWLAMDNNTPSDLVNNAIYIYMMEVTAKMCDAIGRADYAAMLRERHDLAKAEWNKAYVDPATGMTHSAAGKLVHSQASYATPLNFNCFNDNVKEKAEQHLATLAANPSASGTGEKTYPAYTITTGFSGTPNILPSLSRAGKTEDAYKMFTCTDFTSWLYPVTKGATSVWERWNGLEVAFGPNNQNNMNSFNHFALGAVGQWMYEYQLGIKGSDQGYKHFILQPSVGAMYTSLKGDYESHYGMIHSEWTSDGKGNMLTYTATIPANTVATVYVPVKEGVSGGNSIDGAKFEKITYNNKVRVAEYTVASGTYTFEMGEKVVVK